MVYDHWKRGRCGDMSSMVTLNQSYDQDALDGTMSVKQGSFAHIFLESQLKVIKGLIDEAAHQRQRPWAY